jgi:hypothetical protein
MDRARAVRPQNVRFPSALPWYTPWIGQSSTHPLFGPAALFVRTAAVRPRFFRRVCCVMDGTLRNRRLPAAVLLLLCAAPPGAEAQQFVCWPIVPGDTVSRLARRLTGDPGAVYSHAFQIRDPARQMFVPKSQYRRGLSTDWQACVARGLVTVPLAYAPVVASALPAVASAGPAVAPAEPAITITAIPLTISTSPPARAPAAESQDDLVFIAKIGSALSLLLLICAVVADSLARRPIPPVMQRAGEAFVVSFAGPLIDLSSGDPPIQARLRFVRRAQRLEISIAPRAGRRYPNLVDHKRNVEYDVNRVMRVLGPHFVVSDRLRAEGKWVVVPIRLADLKQTGAK